MSEAIGTGPLPTKALPTNEEAARWVADGRNLEQNEELHRNEYPAAAEEASSSPDVLSKKLKQRSTQDTSEKPKVWPVRRTELLEGAMKKVEAGEVSARGFALYAAIAFRIWSADGSCWETQKNLGKRIGISPRQVQTLLDQLTEAGLITIGKRAVGKGNLNEYRLVAAPENAG